MPMPASAGGGVSAAMSSSGVIDRDPEPEPYDQVSLRKSCEVAADVHWGLLTATRSRVRDLRMLRVFAVLRDGCGWRGPGCEGC
jgi:hypothetical protein